MGSFRARFSLPHEIVIIFKCIMVCQEIIYEKFFTIISAQVAVAQYILIFIFLHFYLKYIRFLKDSFILEYGQ